MSNWENSNYPARICMICQWTIWLSCLLLTEWTQSHIEPKIALFSLSETPVYISPSSSLTLNGTLWVTSYPRKWKNSEMREGLGALVTRMTSGGHRWGWVQLQMCFNNIQAEKSWVSAVWTSVGALKPSQMDDELIQDLQTDCSPPPTSTLHLPDVIHVMNAPKLFPFLTALPLLCIIGNANQITVG